MKGDWMVCLALVMGVGGACVTGQPGAGATTAPAPSEGGDTGAGASKEAAWRQTQQDYANIQGEYAKGLARMSGPDSQHQSVVEHCGHRIKFVFDWPTFEMTPWLGKSRSDSVVGEYCALDTLAAIANGCEAGNSYFKAHQRDLIKKITLVTCHYKACPDVAYAPLELGLSADGTNLDLTFCEQAANGMAEVQAWLRANL